MGCSLGNILKRLDFPIKIGFDIDSRVIRAAKIVNLWRSIDFKVGSFADASSVPQIQVLIAINWVHNINADVLIEQFLKISKDYVITEGVKGYKYFHSRELFDAHFDIIIEEQIENRNIILMVKKPNSR